MKEKQLSLIIATAGLLTRFASTSKAMSTTAIARAASVTQPLIYHYYPARKGGVAALVQEGYQWLVDNAPASAKKVLTRESLIEDSLLYVTLPEPKSEPMEVAEETAKDLGIDLNDEVA